MYAMIRLTDTDKPSLHLIYEMWDDMIEKVKVPIYRYEKKELHEDCALYIIIKKKLLKRWAKIKAFFFSHRRGRCLSRILVVESAEDDTCLTRSAMSGTGLRRGGTGRRYLPGGAGW